MNDTGSVVVVDDYEELLTRLEKILGHAGYDVSTFSSPSAFLKAARPAPPCCLLLDVEMPELSGLEVQRALAFNGQAMPMIFMSGHRDLPVAIQAMKGGAIDFLLKPFADAAFAHNLARAPPLRMKPVHKGFHQYNSMLFGRGIHFLALNGVERQRFLAQNMFPPLCRPDRPFAVQAVGQRNIDRVDIFRFQQFFVTAVGFGNAQSGSESLSPG